MMATFMARSWPRVPSVCAERIEEVLDTAVVGRRRRPTPVTELPGRERRSSSATSASATPAPSTPVLCDITLPRPTPAQTHRRSSAAPARARPRCSTSSPRLFDATDGHGARRRRRRPRPRPRAAVEPHRPRAPEAVPVLAAPWRSNLRYGRPRRHRRRAVGGARGRPGRRLRAGDARRARRPHRPGRHQRVGRAAPAARHRPGARAPARRSTCSTTRSRRSTWPPTPGCGPRWRRSPRDAVDADRRPAGLDHHATPTRSSCSRTASSVGLGTHDELLDALPDLRRRSSTSQLTAEEAA